MSHFIFVVTPGDIVATVFLVGAIVIGGLLFWIMK